MIRVRKLRAPARLKSGTSLTEQNCTAYRAGTRKFGFDKTIYGHKTVKDALIKAQNGKCCFCEGRFKAHAYGDVEHYRPKSSVKQARNAKPLSPGYYWLAYAWDNLFWCCEICNRTNKRDFFPLIDPAKRARSHDDEVMNEEPLILNPSGQTDPRRHIKFLKEIAKGETKAGQTTIEMIGLNRSALAEERLARLNELRRLLTIVRLYEGNMKPDAVELVKDARCELDLAVQPTAVFSAMAADFLDETESVQAKAL